MTNNKTIVILGGGHAGIACARLLQKNMPSADQVQVIIVDKKDFMYHSIGFPRALVDVDYTKYMVIPRANAFTKDGNVKQIQGMAERVTTASVSIRKIQNDQLTSEVVEIPFDYLVVALGSHAASPITIDPLAFSKNKIMAELNNVQNHVKNAKSILIVGGGAVGCEVAGEISSAFPEKSVTLLQGDDKLISSQNMREKFSDRLLKALKKQNVKVILGERLPNKITEHSFVQQELVTDKGTRISSDIQLICAGTTVVSGPIKDLNSSLVNKRGQIRVTSTLQFDDTKFSHMFAIGDCNDHATPKMAYWGKLQGEFVAKSLTDLVQHQIEPAEGFPAVTTEAMVLPLGPHGGVSQLPVGKGMVVGNFVTKMIKSKDYLANKMWKMMNAHQ